MPVTDTDYNSLHALTLGTDLLGGSAARADLTLNALLVKAGARRSSHLWEFLRNFATQYNAALTKLDAD
jgi:hypothetical protein